MSLETTKQVRWRALLFTSSLCFVGGCALRGAQPEGWRPSAEVAAVWQAAADYYFGDEKPRERLYLQPTIGGFGRLILPLDSAANVQLTAMHLPLGLYIAWLEANVDSVVLTTAPAIGPYRFRLVRPNDRLPLATPVYQLTFPGFSRGRDTAFVKFGESCGFVCGSDIIFRVTKDPTGAWTAEPVAFLQS